MSDAVNVSRGYAPTFLFVEGIPLETLTSIVVPIVVAIFASTGFWGWLSNRHASNKDIKKAVDDLGRKVEQIDYKVDKNEAVTCRARILRFNKELINKDKHTREEFVGALNDCDKYEAFCTNHPDFQNSQAVLSIENVKRCYKKCCEDGDFL